MSSPRKLALRVYVEGCLERRVATSERQFTAFTATQSSVRLRRTLTSNAHVEGLRCGLVRSLVSIWFYISNKSYTKNNNNYCYLYTLFLLGHAFNVARACAGCASFFAYGVSHILWENYTAPNVLPLTIASDDHPER